MGTEKSDHKANGLELLRKPFEAHQISKLPKQAKWMTDNKDEYRNCDICNGYHHPKAVHLDYVGHAALTDRLLDCDLEWNWQPMTLGEFGQPILDKNGGLWIKLKVCGITRIGYGHADGKSGGDANKEVIGDALRNAAMRFGAALDLWHKGDLHLPDDEASAEKPKPTPEQQRVIDYINSVKDEIKAAPYSEDVTHIIHKHVTEISNLTEDQRKHINNFAANQKELKQHQPVEGK